MPEVAAHRTGAVREAKTNENQGAAEEGQESKERLCRLRLTRVDAAQASPISTWRPLIELVPRAGLIPALR